MVSKYKFNRAEGIKKSFKNIRMDNRGNPKISIKSCQCLARRKILKIAGILMMIDKNNIDTLFF
jgi:hypothetical protein